MSVSSFSTAEKIFIRNYIISQRNGQVEDIRGQFKIPLNDEELSSSETKKDYLIKRLYQLGYSLIVNKKISHSSDKNVYEEISNLITTLSGSNYNKEEIKKRVEELEKKTLEILLGDPHRLHSPFTEKNNFLQYNLNGHIQMDLELEPSFNIELDKKEEMDPIIHVFFSRHIIPSARMKYTKSFKAIEGRKVRLSFNIPCREIIDGQFAVIRFYLHSSFYPTSESGKKMNFTRKRPFYHGFIYLSEIYEHLINDSKRNVFTVEMKDSSLAYINGKMQRENKSHVDLKMKVTNFALSENVKFSRFFSQDLRDKHVRITRKVVDRYYEYLNREEPVLECMRRMHVPTMPCNMYDIALPGAFFLMDLAENQPPEELLYFSLDIHDLSKEEFIKICELQFSNTSSSKIDPQFYRVLFVAWRVVSLFSHMCEYTSDVRFLKGRNELEDVERFIDVFYTRAGDCEDVGKAIIIMFLAWLEMNQEEKKETKKEIYYLIQIYSLFVCSSMKGSAYSAKAESRISSSSSVDFNPDELICHFWTCTIPWNIFSKWTGIPYKKRYNWEDSLTTWVLEGTNDTHSSLRPIYELCEEEKKEQVKEELKRIILKRSELESNFKILQRLEIPGYTFIEPEKMKMSDFYHYANEIWTPLFSFSNGLNVSTWELAEKKNKNKYGVPISTFLYRPQDLHLIPTFYYTREEVQVCTETIKQQWPVVLPFKIPESAWDENFKGDTEEFKKREHHKKSSFQPLERLAKEYPVVDYETILKNASGYVPPYIKYFVKHVSVLDEEILNTLETILKTRRFGFYGIVWKYYGLQVGMSDCNELAEMIEIRLFFK
jgi:hypothetical protein